MGWVPVVGEMLGNSREGDGEPMKSGLIESLMDNLIEFGIGSAAHE